MAEYNEIKMWMEHQYGQVSESKISFNGETYVGYMYGNDECYDTNEFFQYFLTADVLLKMYYEIPDGCEDYNNIDYNHPYAVRDAEAEYWINYVI